MDLYPHQRAGVDWLLAHPRGGLFDEQGLGKTACAIVAAKESVRKLYGGRGCHLVVVPTSVLHNWKREIGMWAPGSSVQLIDTGKVVLNARTEFVIVTHGLLLNAKIQAQLSALRWDSLIVDEAQFFKSKKAKRVDVLYGLKRGTTGLVECADRVWLLTGTPMPNDPTELWTHLTGIAPERIAKEFDATIELEPQPMRFIEFRRQYCKLKPSDYGDGWKVVGSRNTRELRERLKGFSLRRTVKGTLDLPPIRFGTITLTPESLPKELVALEKKLGLSRLSPQQAIAKLRDEVEFSTWRRLCGMAKAEAAGEYLTEWLADNPGQKAVVFAHHKDVIGHLEQTLIESDPVCITGATPAALRTTLVNDFQAQPQTRVALCNIVAGGIGITLTAASNVFFVEQSFVPGDNAQAAARCQRIGQDTSVLVRTFSLAGSVDELLVEILQRKTEMIRSIVK